MEERERKSIKSDSEETQPAPSTSSALNPVVDIVAGDVVEDQINVCSEKFEPLLALYSPSAPPLPFPNIKCFNNVAEYESFLKGGRGRAKPENVEKRQREAMKGVVDPARIERLKKLELNKSSEEGESSTRPKRRQKPPKNVLTKMALYTGSPLGELNRCVEERIRVKVHIRSFKGLRGVCSGFIVAFDKFWNMAMVDVDETFREPLLGEAFHHEKALTISRLFEKLNLQEGGKAEEGKKAKEKSSEHEAANPKAAAKSRGAEPAGWRSGGRAAESELSEAPESKQDQCKVPVKAHTGTPRLKQESQIYGKVHTRHISQLFIRGENVILVNLQPL